MVCKISEYENIQFILCIMYYAKILWVQYGCKYGPEWLHLSRI